MTATAFWFAAIGVKLREELTVRAEIELVPFETLSRSEYKSKLVEPPQGV